MRIFVYETFDLDETDLWNLIVCKYILFLYDFLKVLNVVWDVSIPHPFVLYVFELNVTFVGESLQGYNDGSGGKHNALLLNIFFYDLLCDYFPKAKIPVIWFLSDLFFFIFICRIETYEDTTFYCYVKTLIL